MSHDKFPMGRAPPRSKRSKLIDKGYSEVDWPNCRLSCTEAQSIKAVKDLHEKGYLAQAVFVNPYGEGGHWTVMYKKKVK